MGRPTKAQTELKQTREKNRERRAKCDQNKKDRGLIRIGLWINAKDEELLRRLAKRSENGCFIQIECNDCGTTKKNRCPACGGFND